MSDSKLFTGIVKLLEDAKEFEGMEAPRQAAFRARVSRFLAQIKDPKIKGILKELQEKVGKAEAKAKAKMTPDDLRVEFVKFAQYDTRQRGAYKAKIARLANEATKAGETETAQTLAKLQMDIARLEDEEQRAKILKLAESLSD